ncbi:MAG: AsmA-like C-terminal region-containing protein [Crocinitomicaceae bacterium]|nr:AsmA-like C-terminal region-containing protein [Crocinitomicaceae bacterium]
MEKVVKKKKSIGKRILKWSGISFLLILIALLIIPFVFKDQIKNMALKEVNKMLLAKVDIADFDLTFIRTFPNMTARFDSVSVVGTSDEFKDVRLADIKRLDVELNFWSVVGGDKIEIKGISIDEPKFDVRILKDGKANYDIMKPDSIKTPEEQEPSDFKLSLQSYSINNADIRYDDRQGGMLAVLKNMTHTGEGDLTADVIDFKTKTVMDELSFNMDGMSYLSKVKTDLVANILMEFTEKTSKFTLKENTLALNNLKLSVDGFYEMLENKDIMDLKLNASKATFKDFLSLIPAFYKTGYESMVTKGNLAMNAHVKGVMDDKNMPGWDAGIKIDNASIRYPDLPKSIENISLQANSKFKGGSNMDLMTVDVPKFHASFAGNQLDANLKLRNPMTDPLLDSRIVAKINLATLGQVVPMPQGESYSGKLDADITLKGRMSSIEKEKYEDFNANGTLKLADMLYNSPDLPDAVNVKTMLFRFSPKNLALENLDAKMGKSDFKINGTIDNYLGYFLRDEMLKGSFNFNSNQIDLDQIMGTSGTTTTSSETTAPAETSGDPLLIPDNVDFNLNANIKTLKYSGIDLKNVQGNIKVKEEIASLNDLTMNAMGGFIGLTGSYNTQNHDKPKIDIRYILKELDIAQLVNNFVSIQKLAPIAKYTQGKISSTFSMNTFLTPSLEPIYSSLTGGGDLSTTKITISGFEPLKKISQELKMEKLATQTIDNFKAKFKFENGKVALNPFDVKLGNIVTNISGTSSIEQDIDYALKMNIPKDEIPASMLKLVESGLQKVNGITPKIQVKELPAFIPVNLKVIGKMKDPKVTSDLKESIMSLTGNFKDQLKDAGKDAVNKAKDSVRTVVDKKVNEVKEDFTKKKEEIMKDAQKQADNVKAEGKKAGDAIRNEGQKGAQKLLDEAGSNPLKKKAAEIAGNKIIKEANESANKTEAEANKQADGIMTKAREKADQLK